MSNPEYAAYGSARMRWIEKDEPGEFRDANEYLRGSRLADVGTGLAAIYVEESGQNCIVVVSGANARLTPSDVEAELARTRVTDRGMEAVAGWQNLRSLDLTRTAVTSAGIARLAPLMRLERINLTQTAVDGPGAEAARRLPAMPRVWAFQGP